MTTGCGKGSVLVVDDEEGFRDFFRFALEPEGYEVVAVETAAAAETEIVSREFTLVLLDGYLKGASGLDALKRIKRIRPGQAVAVMSVMSGVLEDDALSLGAWVCIGKPHDTEQVIRLVEESKEAGA